MERLADGEGAPGDVGGSLDAEVPDRSAEVRWAPGIREREHRDAPRRAAHRRVAAIRCDAPVDEVLAELRAPRELRRRRRERLADEMENQQS